MSAQPSTPAPHATPQPPLILIAVCALLSAGFRTVQNSLHSGALIVRPYWASFYAVNYQDGFRRRALIGTFCRLVEPRGVSVLLINALAIGALLTVLTLFVRSFRRMARPVSLPATLFFLAFFASALTSTFLADVGDTLLIAFTLFFLIAVLPLQWVAAPAARLALGIAGLVVAFFVHEAAIFMLAPLLPFLARPRPRVMDFALPSVALLALLALSVHWSTHPAHLTYPFLTIPACKPIELVGTPSFGTLLHTEYTDNFTSNSGRLLFLIKCLSIFALGVSGTLAVALTVPFQYFRRVLHVLLVVLFYSIPLWIIAHDWGRFLGCSIFLTMLVVARMPVSDVPPFFDRLAARLVDWSREPVVQCAVLLVLLVSPFRESQVTGIETRDAVGAFAICALAAFYALRRPAPALAGI